MEVQRSPRRRGAMIVASAIGLVLLVTAVGLSCAFKNANSNGKKKKADKDPITAAPVEVSEVRDLVAREPARRVARQIPLRVGHPRQNFVERPVLGGQVVQQLVVGSHRAASIKNVRERVSLRHSRCLLSALDERALVSANTKQEYVQAIYH